MNGSRRTAIVVGVLFIIATAFLFIGEAFYSPILDNADYLTNAYPNRRRISVGILIEFFCVLSIPLIAIFMYPILKRDSEPLALAYVAFRSLEAALFVVGEAKLLSLIDLSERYLDAGNDAQNLQAIGDQTKSEFDGIFPLYVLVFTFGALILYTLLYRTNLVPRFLSIWGFLATLLLLAGAILSTLDTFPESSASTVELFFAPPIAVNEMVLALWLIFKGFNRESISAYETANTDETNVSNASAPIDGSSRLKTR